jgi:uncharacterized protein YbjT (DUF2867 family)
MIMVAGSTGVLGFEICRRLRARGQSVRVLVRATSAREKVRALEAIGCDTVVGDLKDRRSLDAACAGADVVIVETAVQCVGHPAARNAVISFGGPDALSQRDAVRIFEEAFGKPFTVTEVPEEALEAQWKSAGDHAIVLGVDARRGARRSSGRAAAGGSVSDADDDRAGVRGVARRASELNGPAGRAARHEARNELVRRVLRAGQYQGPRSSPACRDSVIIQRATPSPDRPRPRVRRAASTPSRRPRPAEPPR